MARAGQTISVCEVVNQQATSGQLAPLTQCSGAIVYNTPIGYVPTNGSGQVFGGVRSDPGSSSNLSTTPVDAWNTCYYVNNYSPNSLFVPFASQSEWTHFISYANGSTNVSLTNCARSASLPVYPDSISTDQLYCINPTVVSVTPAAGTTVVNPGGSTIPTVTLPYARANSSVSYGVTVNYSCGNGSAISGETATATIVPLSSTHSATLLPYTNVYSATIPDIISYGASPSPMTTTIGYETVNGTDSSVNYNDWKEIIVYAPTTHGSCGTANGQSYLTAPSSNLCASGNTASSVSGSGPWAWTCTAGSTVSCGATLTVVNGTCGTANGGSSTSAPSTNLCIAGTASAVTGNGSIWSWTCAGNSSGTNASCSASVGVNGACGSADSTTAATAPSANLCGAGTASAVTSSGGNWTWTCAGVGTGSTGASCTAPVGSNGTCGSANGTTAISAPSTNLCSAGTASAVTGSGGNWAWTCTGSGTGSTNASCTAPLGANGSCGTANGTTVSSKPTTNLCSAGTSSSVSGSGPWTWSCSTGSNPASCSATGSHTCPTQTPPSGTPTLITAPGSYSFSSTSYVQIDPSTAFGGGISLVTISGGPYIEILNTMSIADVDLTAPGATVVMDGSGIGTINSATNLTINGSTGMNIFTNNATVCVVSHNAVGVTGLNNIMYVEGTNNGLTDSPGSSGSGLGDIIYDYSGDGKTPNCALQATLGCGLAN